VSGTDIDTYEVEIIESAFVKNLVSGTDIDTYEVEIIESAFVN
jgi:hypothetical protein